MISERIKGWLSTSSKMVAASARVAKKQAELATLNNVTLPRLYHAIGKRIIGSKNLPADLVHHRQRIQELEAAIAAKPEQPTQDTAVGFAAKAKHLAQQAASTTAKATADTASKVKIQAAYVALGKQAIEAYGPQALPQDLREKFNSALQQRDDLLNEKKPTRGDVSKQSMLGRRRLRIVLPLVCAVVGTLAFQFFLSRGKDDNIAANVDVQQDSRVEQVSVHRKTNAEEEARSAVATVSKANSSPRPTGSDSFSGRSGLTDAQLVDVVANAPDLKSLDLSRCKQLTDQCFKAIKQLTDLEELFLPDTPTITGAGLAAIRHLKLERLSAPSILDDPIAYGMFLRMHASSKNIGSWDGMEGSFVDTHRTFGDEGLRQYVGLRGVQHLHLPETGVTNKGIGYLHKIPDLISVSIPLTRDIDDSGIALLAKCRQLKSVSLTACSRQHDPDNEVGQSPVTEAAVAAMRGMDLTYLELPPWLRTERSFPHFLDTLSPKSPQRQTLTLVSGRDLSDGHWPCTNNAIVSLQKRGGPPWIELRGPGVNDDHLSLLWSVPGLSVVVVSDSEAKGSGLKGIEKAHKLEALSLSDLAYMRADAVGSIALSKSLKELDISGTPWVNDESVVELAQCKQLRRLSVMGALTTPSLLFRMQKLLPDCKITIEEAR
jgi:hypothetical protein